MRTCLLSPGTKNTFRFLCWSPWWGGNLGWWGSLQHHRLVGLLQPVCQCSLQTPAGSLSHPRHRQHVWLLGRGCCQGLHSGNKTKHTLKPKRRAGCIGGDIAILLPLRCAHTHTHTNSLFKGFIVSIIIRPPDILCIYIKLSSSNQGFSSYIYYG